MPLTKKNTRKQKTNSAEDAGFLNVDPVRIRFQHARIRPFFSGGGQSVTETLEMIRRGEMSPNHLPPIQVIVGPETNEGPWYFSLNNRRLWVLKRCREEGLLENNVIRVRVRNPKSEAELRRYTVENCTLEAKFMRDTGIQKEREIKEQATDNAPTEETTTEKEQEESEDDSDSSENNLPGFAKSNPFSALS